MYTCKKMHKIPMSAGGEVKALAEDFVKNSSSFLRAP